MRGPMLEISKWLLVLRPGYEQGYLLLIKQLLYALNTRFDNDSIVIHLRHIYLV